MLIFKEILDINLNLDIMTNIFLNDVWSLYFHDNNSEWKINDYIFIDNINSIEKFIEIFEAFDTIWYSGMFFLFREHITPIWEDPFNINGGCYSYKVSSDEIQNKWFELFFNYINDKLGKNKINNDNINGISITVKKNSNILRIWLKDNELANINNYNIINNKSKFSSILYKKHK